MGLLHPKTLSLGHDTQILTHQPSTTSPLGINVRLVKVKTWTNLWKAKKKNGLAKKEFQLILP